MPLAMMTGHSIRAKAYVSHTKVLRSTIHNMSKLMSPALRNFHVRYTWGINVTLVRNAPKWPINCIQSIGNDLRFMNYDLRFGEELNEISEPEDQKLNLNF